MSFLKCSVGLVVFNIGCHLFEQVTALMFLSALFMFVNLIYVSLVLYGDLVINYSLLILPLAGDNKISVHYLSPC